MYLVLSTSHVCTCISTLPCTYNRTYNCILHNITRTYNKLLYLKEISGSRFLFSRYQLRLDPDSCSPGTSSDWILVPGLQVPVPTGSWFLFSRCQVRLAPGSCLPGTSSDWTKYKLTT